LALAVVASSGLNPDADGRPSPVVVRIYQLTSTGEFLGAEFAALYPNDSATLGKTLVSKQEFSALPGQHDSVKLELASETRALGVLVAFRDIDHARWRVTASADAPPAQLLLGAASAALQPKP
jgi:type VI secretion system protein VasD